MGSSDPFFLMAPVGQTERHVPQEVQIDSRSGWSMKAPMRDSRPAPSTSMAPMNCRPGPQPLAQRPHMMQSSIAIEKNGLLVSTASRGLGS